MTEAGPLPYSKGSVSRQLGLYSLLLRVSQVALTMQQEIPVSQVALTMAPELCARLLDGDKPVFMFFITGNLGE